MAVVQSSRRVEARRAIEIVFGEPENQLRSNMRLAMKNANFDKITEYDSVAKMRQHLETHLVDLVIVDLSLRGGDVVDLIKDVRYGKLGGNPFVPFVLTLWNPTKEMVHSAVNSGADDILVKPVSPQQLLDRISVITDNRKPFIVTCDYIGPDRRKDPGRKSEIPTFEVPNTLKAKLNGVKVDPTKLAAIVNQAQNRINDQRLKRNAFQISFLVELVLPSLKAGTGDDPETIENLQTMYQVGRDTGERLLDTDFEHVSSMCNNLIEVAERLLETPSSPSSKDIQLLTPLSKAILTGFHPTEEAADLAGQINSALTGYEKRREEPKQTAG